MLRFCHRCNNETESIFMYYSDYMEPNKRIKVICCENCQLISFELVCRLWERVEDEQVRTVATEQ